MVYHYIVYILVAVICFGHFCIGEQECLNACELSVSTCNYVNYPIYPNQLNVTKNEAQAGAIISKVEGLSFLISKECIDQVKRYTCGYLYPSCVNSTEEGSPPTKVKPCIQMCLDVNTVCAPYISALTDDEKQFINCSQVDPIDNSPFFATDGDCYSLDNIVPIKRCNNDSDDPGYHPTSGCQKYDPTLSPLTSSYCAPFISEEIYVPYLSPANAQSSLDVIANSTLWLISKLYPVLAIGCYKSLLSLLCQTAYPTCNRILDTESGYTIELGAYPCNEYCQTAIKECAVFSGLLGYDLINCSMTGGNGNLLWPKGPSYVVQVTENITVENTCANSLFPSNASSVFILPPITKCPSLLVKNPHPTDKDEQCWIPCPDPTYTAQMWYDLTVIGLVGASISFSLMAFLLLSTLLSAKKRVRRIHMCVYTAVLLQSSSFFINTAHPEDHVWCDDAVTYATSANAACGAQAFIFHWFTLAIAAWWLIIAYHMYGTVVQRKKIDIMQQYEKYYHMIGWGIPLILAIITASIGSHGYGPPASWCYIHDRGFTNDYGQNYKNKGGIAVDYWVFYIPIYIALLIAAILLSLVFHYIYKTFRMVDGIRAMTKYDLRVQQRVMFFVVLLFIIFTLVSEWRFSLEASDVDKLKNDDFLYVYCQIKNDLGIEYSDSCLDKELPYRVNYSHTAFETFLASTFGFFVFIAFGTDYSIYWWWAQALRIRTKEALFEYIATETTQASSNSVTEKPLTDLSTDSRGSKPPTKKSHGSDEPGATVSSEGEHKSIDDSAVSVDLD